MIYSDYEDNFELLVLFHSRGRETSQKHIKNHKKIVCPMIISSDNLQVYSSLTCIVQTGIQTMMSCSDKWTIHETVDFSGAIFCIFIVRIVPFYTTFLGLVFISPNSRELSHLGLQQSRDLNLELRHPKWRRNIHQICLADPVNTLLSRWRELVFPLTLPPLKSTSCHLKKICWKILWMLCSDLHVDTHLTCLSCNTLGKTLP